MMQPVFHRTSVESFANTITSCVGRKLAAWQDGARLNVADEMMHLTQQVIISTLFGTHFDDGSTELARAITTRRRYMEQVFFSPLPEFFPSRLKREYTKALGQIDNTIDKAIQERRENAAFPKDLLSLLMHATYDDGSIMTDAQVRDEVRTLLITGYETMGEALAWTCYLVGRHPVVANKLFAEVDELLGGQTARSEDVPRLRYTAMVLAESMRLYPPTWIFIRIARQDDVLPSGTTIPAGSKIYLCQYVMHRNARYFPQPDLFDPERFSESAKKERPQFAYFPFGGGPRVCIGDSFAKMEGALVLASIAQQFNLTVEPGQTIVPDPRMTLHPKNGIMVRVHRRINGEREP
jgi:cytochrome P450